MSGKHGDTVPMSHQYPDSRQRNRKVVGAGRGQVSESALKMRVPWAHPCSVCADSGAQILTLGMWYHVQ